MSDHGEAKLRVFGRLKRFEQSPRVCVYGCPGLCLTKCIQAGECVVGFATYTGRGVVEDVGKELDVIELAGRLSDIYNLCESDESRMDLARLMVARGIRAGPVLQKCGHGRVLTASGCPECFRQSVAQADGSP